MKNFYYKFKTKKSIRNLLLFLYCITAWVFLIEFTFSMEFEKFGFFILNQRGLYTKFTGQSAINTILFLRYLMCLSSVISIYYTISALLSFKFKTLDKEKQSKEKYIIKKRKNILYLFCLVWTLLWSIGFLIIIKYYKDTLLGMLILIWPILLCAFLIPIFLFNNKLKLKYLSY